MLLGQSFCLRTNQLRRKKFKMLVARRKLLGNVHDQRIMIFCGGGYSINIDILRMENEIDEDGLHIEEIDGGGGYARRRKMKFCLT